MYLRWLAAVTVLAAAVALCGYFIRATKTDSWPTTGCTVAGTRVIRDDVADSGRAIVMYRGEFQLRYSVGGQSYYVWANSGWSDVDKQFIQNRIDALPSHCNFRIRYNPNHPSEAIVVSEQEQ